MQESPELRAVIAAWFDCVSYGDPEWVDRHVSREGRPVSALRGYLPARDGLQELIQRPRAGVWHPTFPHYRVRALRPARYQLYPAGQGEREIHDAVVRVEGCSGERPARWI